MLASIISIDLTAPIPAVEVVPPYESLLVLARIGHVPVALVSIPIPPALGCITPKHLHATLVAATRPLLWEQGIERQLQQQSDPTEWPAISVVVCTRDRPAALAHCLAALKALDYPNYEVVVVDNASREASTAEVVAHAGLRYVREDRPGLDWARNCGAAAAQHDIIAYTDDDVRVDSGWLRGLARAFADPQVDAVTGLVLPAELDTDAQALFETYGGMSKGMRPRRFQHETLRSDQLIGVHALGVGANMAYRRHVLAHVGGFDTALDVGTPSGGGGDLDMFHRVLVAGFTFHYEPTAMVWHQHRRDMAGLQRQIENNGRAFGAYLLKIWKQRSAPRHVTARFAYRWMRHYLLPQVWRSIKRSHHVPLSLTLGELRGAIDAPRAFRATYLHDHRLRTRTGA
ncbi:glycosyl transferase, group 2 family protein [Oscillochloris trichoides DG-6]|uniref:Glycosyl transferase, group 2 family protein n=1 Tax=Oscillochloris trichoides DG-6 TaxID=765420 RepID=E1IBL3_9CHLR|nr:glycosyltransferase [Oscillochloris trichoides]EFO81432.1 glycosyl transferase, group 2 family protein [Oscillochloris trichoides DG-6]